jgi:hypothetical protein
VPDDLTARKLEDLQHSLNTPTTDLGRKLDKLSTQFDTLNKQLGKLDGMGRRLDALDQIVVA